MKLPTGRLPEAYGVYTGGLWVPSLHGVNGEYYRFILHFKHPRCDLSVCIAERCIAQCLPEQQVSRIVLLRLLLIRMRFAHHVSVLINT